MEIKGESIDNEYCRRGAPCGYPNGTGKANDWASTRDAPTEDENEDVMQAVHSSTLLSEAPLLHSYTLQS